MNCHFHAPMPDNVPACSMAPGMKEREELKKVKKCPNCGASCSVDSHFCSRCGMVLHEETDLTVPEAEEQPAQPQETHPENQSEEKSEEKPLIEENL